MNSLIINYLVLATALLLSGIAAFYSVIGLAAIFPGSFWPIIIMGGALEVSKIVTASWLYRNWKTVPKLMRGYMVSAVVVLIMLTSMGIFGFLSKAHIEQTTAQSASVYEIQAIEIEINNEKTRVANAQRVLDNLDRVATQSTTINSATSLARRQKSERESQQTVIKEGLQKIVQLNKQLVPLKQEQAIAAADLGPIKYITEMIYGEESSKYQDKAVRLVIIIIILVFDPLAILLIIAANIGFAGSLYKYKTLIRSGLQAKI